MKTYRTAQVAEIIGVHPNTVRLYEKLGLIPPAGRRENGYRVFNEKHVAQFRLARLAFQVEVLQNGLRKKIIEAVKASAAGDYDGALSLAGEYLLLVRRERENAEEAVEIVRRLFHGGGEDARTLRRKEAAACLGVSMDTLRSWEMNGLLSVKRRENGYRVYTGEDLRRLKVIRALRCAGYSLEAILRLLREVSADPEADWKAALNTPAPDEDIISVCDRLIHSLEDAEKNALAILAQLGEMKGKYE